MQRHLPIIKSMYHDSSAMTLNMMTLNIMSIKHLAYRDTQYNDTHHDDIQTLAREKHTSLL